MPSSKLDQAEYLINLLGRKRNTVEREVGDDLDHKNSHSSNSDTDFEDVVYTHLTRDEMMKQLHNKASAGEWTLSLPSIELGYQSSTTEQQDECLDDVVETYLENPKTRFYKEAHFNYIEKCLTAKLPSGYKSLDANHPWMMYWLVNSHLVIKDNDGESRLSKDIVNLVNRKIESCIIDEGRGGIAGGANQMGHLASTYAAVLTLVLTRNTPTLLKIRTNLYTWIMGLKRKTKQGSSFLMHGLGEYDTRSTYCALVICVLLNTATPELVEGVADWIISCQTYEGGFAGVPNTEAHGGYTFCAFSSLFILNTAPQDIIGQINFDKFVRWCVARQTCEGGFSGRTNKLVDVCYSFWIGALMPMIDVLQKSHTFNKEALRNYILRIAQVKSGGFRDKPGKSVDFYHTNYALCGLSCCEHDYRLIDDGENSSLAFRIVENSTNETTFTYAVNPVFGIPTSFCNSSLRNV
ncbi:RAM1 [Candida theae]|uniref:Protein farnesyltransferase subunit beta n=1 Tax=Candida theae TaxID=1198502 RepID=A0AAD5BBQ6_9ASCO|nr:RAM1 [Candida theae]KAI5950052.1 RAM1 [Candida theae]